MNKHIWCIFLNLISILVNNLGATILSQVCPQTFFPLFETTEAGEGVGCLMQGNDTNIVFLICKNPQDVR